MAAVNVTFGGSGGLIFASSASSFNAASLQLAGGGLFIGAADYANGQTGPLGSGTAALVIGVTSGTSATAERGQPGLHDLRAQQPDYRQ